MSDPENLLGLGGADVSPSEVSSVQPPVGKLNIKQKVELLETSPTFMGMRYSDQVYARQYALGKLPEFNTLGVSEQTAIRNAVAAMPPAYADKSFENYQKNFESLGAALPYIASSRLANTVVQKGAMAVAGPLMDLVYGKDDPRLKVLKGDPDAAKLHDYLSLKYGSKVAMPEGVRDVINKSVLKYIPGVNLLGSDNLADALGDLVGIVGDISATAGGLPGAGVAGVAKAGLLSKAGVASELAVGGKLAASGAKGILPAVATVAAKVVPDAFSGAAFGVGRAAIVDPQAVSDAQGITNTAIGWAVGAAILSSVEGGRDIRSAMTRTNALRRSVSQAYPKMLKENAGRTPLRCTLRGNSRAATWTSVSSPPACRIMCLCGKLSRRQRPSLDPRRCRSTRWRGCRLSLRWDLSETAAWTST